MLIMHRELALFIKDVSMKHVMMEPAVNQVFSIHLGMKSPMNGAISINMMGVTSSLIMVHNSKPVTISIQELQHLEQYLGHGMKLPMNGASLMYIKQVIL